MQRPAAQTLARSSGLLMRPALAQRGLPSTVRSMSVVPRVAKSSFWKSLVPKAWHRENRPAAATQDHQQSWLSREWNPATFFIVILLFIGSASINMIWLRNDVATYSRRANVRIGLLREVIEKVQKGEDVDVEKVLGTGEPEKELAWEQLLEEVENGNIARNQKKQDKAKTPDVPAANTKIATHSEPTQTPSRGKPAFF